MEDEVPEAVAIEEDQKEEQGSPRKHVPVTLITGFLGSGKTTLVRHILTEHHGFRVAVIMNEYGESVEGSYFHTPDGAKANLNEWVELSNGCMCCAVKSEFVQAIETLMTKRANFDHILIETTGLANPGPVAAALWTDEELEAGVQLDSIVTVVDAINIDRQLNDTRPEGIANEAQVQLAYADLILLNKMDLSGEEAIVRAEADIRAINSSVQIVRTSHCAVDLSIILNRQGYNRNAEVALGTIAEAEEGDTIAEGENEGEDAAGPSKVSPLSEASVKAHAGEHRNGPMRSLSRRSASSCGSAHGSRAMAISLEHELTSQDVAHGHSHSKPHPLHDKGIQTTTLRCQKPLDLEKLKAFMDRLLWDREMHPEDIYRVKGLLDIGGSGMKHVLQAVYELYHINETTEWAKTEARQSMVVIIGRNLKKDLLQQWFQACAVADA